MEIFFGILAIGVLLVLISCGGWILKGLSVVGKFGLGCLLKGLLYFVCYIVVIGVFLTILGFI